MLMMSSCMPGLSWPRPMISKDCTSGTPELIMVASCRLNTAISLGVTFFLAAPNSDFGFFLTLSGLMPRRRSSARTRATLLPLTSPLVRAPFLSVPSHTKMSCFAVFSATLHRNHAIEFFQGRHASLDLTKARGSKVGDALLLGHVRKQKHKTKNQKKTHQKNQKQQHKKNAHPSQKTNKTQNTTNHKKHQKTNENNHGKSFG